MTSPTTTMTGIENPTAGLHLFEAATRETIALGIFPKSTKDEFRTSFGEMWPTKVGRYTLWDLQGIAQDTWEQTLFPRAFNILTMNPIDPRKLSRPNDRPSASLHGWMVGIDQDHAHPTMVLVSEDKNYRDEAQRLMKKKKALKDTGFRMMALAARIERDGGSPFSEGQEQLSIAADNPSTNEDVPMIDPPENPTYNHSTDSIPNIKSPNSTADTPEPTVRLKRTRELAGMRISTASASATIGGQMLVNGGDFVVTVAHIFQPLDSKTAAPGDLKLEFDNDGFSDESSDTDYSSIKSDDDSEIVALSADKSMETISLGVLRHFGSVDFEEYGSEAETEAPNDSYMPSKTRDPVFSGRLTKTSTVQEDKVSHGILNIDGNVSVNDAYMVDHDIDCALLPTRLVSNMSYSRIGHQIPTPTYIKLEEPRFCILAATVHGPLEGRYEQRATCAIKPEGSDKFIKTLSVYLYEHLLPGDCGAWFIDVLSDTMAGMIISGCSSLKLAYVLPRETLLQRVEEFATSDKRSNKPGYYESSTICDRCRRMRLECLSSPRDPLNRCSNCIKRNLSCIVTSGPLEDNDSEEKFSVRDTLELRSRLWARPYSSRIPETEWGYLSPCSSQNWVLPLKLRSHKQFGTTQNSKASLSVESGSKGAASTIVETYSLAYLIGRHSLCDVRAQTSRVSYLHCSIFYAIISGVTRAFITDTSTNGTLINRQPVHFNETYQLNGGDIISIGKIFNLVFRESRENNRGIYATRYSKLQSLEKKIKYEVYLCVEQATGLRYVTRESKHEGTVPSQSIALHVTLAHPNIVSPKEIFLEDECCLQIEEHATEGDLFDWVTKKEKLTEEETQKIFRQLFSAVKYLHDRNIIHRDIKPENISVMNKDVHVKLGDFSLSIRTGKDGFDNTLCGTPSYVAPEVLQEADNRRYNKAVDVWSLGVVLYICLCGFPPFSDELYSKENPHTLSEQIKLGRFDYPSPYWDTIGDPALDLIDHMLVVDPEKRFTIKQCMKHPWMTEVNATTTGSAYQHDAEGTKGSGKQKA